MDGDAKFWDVLLQYSYNKTNKNMAKDEWTALSKVANLCDLKGGLSKELIDHYKIKKLPPRKNNCICTHWIVKNKLIFNIKNRNILTLGSCCIRRYLSYTPKKICLECETPFSPSGRKGRNYCPPCKLKWCSERGYSYRRINYKDSEREKPCLDCKTPFRPSGRRGRNYCPSCKRKWCSERGYRYGRFHYESMRQTGRSMRENFHNFGNFNVMPNEGRESEFCGTGTSMSYNPSAMLNRNRQSEFFGCVSSKSYDPSATLNKELQSESRRCDSGESSNPKAMPIPKQNTCDTCEIPVIGVKEHQSQFRGHGLSHSLNNNNNLSKIVNLNLIQQVKALKFTNKAVLFQYLASQEYIEGTKKINFGIYSTKKMKDFNDHRYYKLFIENVIKLNEGKQLNDEKLAFYFYVSYINKKI
nr:PREDICTED: uncharacterized protein LOC109030517 [Bemisia tabaci]